MAKRRSRKPAPKPQLAAFLQGVAAAIPVLLSEGKLGRARGAHEVLARHLVGGRAAADAYLSQTGGVTPDQLRALRPRGGRPSHDARNCALAGIVDVPALGPQRFLAALELNASKARGWFWPALARGRRLLQEKGSPPFGPDVAAVFFLASYLKDDPRGLIDALSPYLADDQLPGCKLDASQISTQLRRALPPDAT